VADLWGLVWGKPQVDPRALADAIERTAPQAGLDFRTRLLIRDASDALERHWGAGRWEGWLSRSPAREAIQTIRREGLGEPGFPHLEGALMDLTDPEIVREYLRELGTALHHPTRMAIGGAIALILADRLSRATEDIDVVDEVPAELRKQHKLLEGLLQRYGLKLTHFQSHFLPSGWDRRTHSLAPFGRLQVDLVDELDIFLGKLFSAREKDRDDLRQLLRGLDRGQVLHRLQATCGSFLADANLRANAERNWYVLTGEALAP